MQPEADAFFNAEPTLTTRDIKLASVAHILGFEPVKEGLAINVLKEGEAYCLFRFKDHEDLRELFKHWSDREKWAQYKQANPRSLAVLFRAAFDSNNQSNPLIQELCAAIEKSESRIAYVLAAFLMREWIKDATKQTGTVSFQRSKTNPRKWRFQTFPGDTNETKT